MTEERDDLLGIFDRIANIDGMWEEVKFVRRGVTKNGKIRLTIVATDQYGNDYTYQEDY